MAKTEQWYIDEFMKAFRGVPGNIVANAMTELTPGVSWTGCGKRHMAEQLAGSILGSPYSVRMKGVSIDAIKKQIATIEARRKRAR